MRAEKIVNVKAFHRDREVDDLLGWCTKPVHVYNKESGWTPTEATEILFGRVASDGFMTHMSYTLDTRHTKDWNEWLDSTRARQDRFYFDAGSNGYPIYVEMGELRRAMIELELYKLTEH